MCGIVGYIGAQDAAPILLEGLGRLEYRGYDSAGVAVVTRSGLKIRKSQGRVATCCRRLPARFKGAPGIGHTRWATHGEPTENAHPHTDTAGRIAVVHNGIIENADELRAKLMADGVEFASQTDTEVVPTSSRPPSRPARQTSSVRSARRCAGSSRPTASP